MGQHKHNPTAQAAKDGKLKPKKKKRRPRAGSDIFTWLSVYGKVVGR